MDLREEIEAATRDVFGGAVRKQARELADRILTIIQLANADARDLPDGTTVTLPSGETFAWRPSTHTHPAKED